MRFQYILLAATVAFTLESAERFDHLVRGDFFAGFAGNQEAFDRGMKKSEEVLKTDPNHAEALVWHGAGLYFLSGQAFRKQDMAKGMELFSKGIAEMQQAVTLAPNNVGVRIPRAAALSGGARMMPPDMARPLWESVASDYYTVYQMQEKQLDQMGTHPKGELLFGLADTYSRLGANDKADFYFNALKEKMPGTAYAKRADKWFETKKPLSASEATCIGCHTGK